MRVAEKVGVGAASIQPNSVLSADDEGIYEGCNEKRDV